MVVSFLCLQYRMKGVGNQGQGKWLMEDE